MQKGGICVKRTLAVAAVVLLVAVAPAFCDWRFDLGLDAIFGVGAVSDEGSDTADFGDLNFITLPMGGASYEWEVGPVGIGVGVPARVVQAGDLQVRGPVAHEVFHPDPGLHL